MTKPISILLPVRNGERFLPRLMPQISAMADKDDEFLIIDDGSDDATGRILHEWAREDARVRVLKGGGSGLVTGLNLGLRESTNDFVARFDVDDQYSPVRLSVQRAAMNDNTVACFTDYDFIDSKSKEYGTIPSAVFPSAVSISLISSQRTAHPSVLFSKSAVIQAGGYRMEDFPAEDLSLWLRLSRVGDLISVPSVLLHYRINQGSISLLRRYEMQKKTQDLLGEIGILQKDIYHVLENWRSIYHEYESFPMPWQRKLLLFLELRRLDASKSFSTKDRKYLRQLERYIWSHPQSSQALMILGSGAIKRKALRWSHS